MTCAPALKELEGCLKAYLDPGAGDQRVVASEVGCLFSLGVIEVAATLAQGVVIAMHFRKGLLADVAGARLMELGAIIGEAVPGGMLGLRRLQPKRRIFRGAALHAQARRRQHFPVMFLCRFPLGTPKCLCHLHQIVPLRLRDEAGERQQFAAPILSEAREVRTIGLDGAQHAHTGAHVGVAEDCAGSGMGGRSGVNVVHIRPTYPTESASRGSRRSCRNAKPERWLPRSTWFSGSGNHSSDIEV